MKAKKAYTFFFKWTSSRNGFWGVEGWSLHTLFLISFFSASFSQVLGTPGLWTGTRTGIAGDHHPADSLGLSGVP